MSLDVPAPIRIGDVTIHPLVEEPRYLAAPHVFFPQLDEDPQPADAWYLQPPHVDAATGQIVLNIQPLLVLTGDRVILLDTGGGNGKVRTSPGFHLRQRPFWDNFSRLGLTPDDVDTVVLTHLHVDHVGFATTADGDGWVPSFRNARYLLTRQEFDFWTGPGGRAGLERTGDYVADSVLPLHTAGVLDFVAPDLTLTPEVRLVPAFGHTPGNLFVEIASRGERAVYAGDGIHHAVQLAHPEWSTRYCVDGHGSAAQRRALLDSIADTATILIPAHFPVPTAGRVVRDGDAFRYVFHTDG
ncbi:MULTISPECIES: MBL fold metallo-hydrolase [Micromonospora]|uniref:Glyoxylase, beta-lactamase superfamily II n=1 Tax=Micromonospora yangpuensis TaxID=683228 RepID=A0A1C6UQW0_9ACTN|nr:MBL fold metallo-hydrolase [Micromonospora yangpuensis]GGM07303.1 MBL fold metallo-hydrolase [Micromonospora yangpuensis]SCL56444.1 Glyoxylase, beta-lactamase superfamily II [Micromonospora yangpuensis]